MTIAAEKVRFPQPSVETLHMTKTNAVCAYLREAIITGYLRPGDRIGQQELAEVLEMSPTPVREGLHKLVALGILSYVPHHGVQVPVPDRQTIDEIFLIRSDLEAIAIRKTAECIQEPTLQYLEDLAYNQMPEMLAEFSAGGSYTRFRVANYTFHKTLYTSSMMAVIPEMIDNLWARSMVPDEIFQSDIQRVENAVTEHHEIITALRKRDSDQAYELMRHHVETTQRSYLRYLDTLALQ